MRGGMPGQRPGMPGQRPGMPQRPPFQQRPGQRPTQTRRERPQAPSMPVVAAPPPVTRSVTLAEGMTGKDLADKLEVRVKDVLAKLLMKRMMMTINSPLDTATARDIAREFGSDVEMRSFEEELLDAEVVDVNPADIRSRAPVVTVMGHVDHGKTSLLDAIREARVAEREAGGITQHIGAYHVDVGGGRSVVFLDTPGHEAFTLMRARGAKVTDVVVLVVAADDGVMPQTVEAIDHAKAAGVPIIVAINKIDRPDANPDKVKTQLTEHELLVEEYGGDVVAVPVSARTKVGLPELLEHILLVAEIEELRADPSRQAEGVVLEAHLDPQRGPMATALVQNGTLHLGDTLVLDEGIAHVRAMYDDRNHQLKTAGPSTPVKLMGLGVVPNPGDLFLAVRDEKTAKAMVQEREKARLAQASQAGGMLSLATLFEAAKAGVTKDLNVVLKTDVQGSIDPVRTSLQKLGDEAMRVNVLHAAAGTVTESDVMLAAASKGVVLAFNTRVEPGARRQADIARVEIRSYDVIYHLVEEVEAALRGMLEPETVEVIEGHAEVRQVFVVGRRAAIAGSQVIDGKAMRNAMARVLRAGKVVADERVGGLKRFKDDAREVNTGLECGITLDSYQEFEVGDIIEFYRKEKQSAA